MKQTVHNKWLGPVNAHWLRPKIGTLGTNVSNKNTGMQEKNLLTLSYGNIKRKDINTSEGLLPASFESYQIVEPGDIVFRFTDLQNDHKSLRSALVRERGIITSAYVNFRPNPQQVHSLYFSYLMRALDLRKAFYQMGSGVRQSLKFEELAMVSIPLPSLEIQHAIANYLNRETHKIDAMLDKLDDLGRLLEDRKKSEIREFATPKNGNFTQMKYLAQVSLGKTVQNKKILKEDQLTPYVRAANIQPHGLVLDHQKMYMTSDEIIKYDIISNDVLVVEGGGGFGRSVTIESPMTGWGFQNHVIRLRPNKGISGKFLDYTVKSHLWGGLLDILSDGATIPAISSEKVRELPVLAITSQQQHKIVNYLDETTTRINTMLAKIRELKILLTERRGALITAAVTGQIEVH